ncbi:lipoamide acyltransferase component of branched-chain alpha-keto acid dehydrogenase complex [Dictyobacter sp. S3.2.2.5]|uniref:Dihydrolipoamide acetyltransferase component of pyruvate dehydrogenase complex n=1 Tax=Dictyobacter halimunensis TaxID=3026934 RepID=A0ABQ6G0U6_9CHLR|nr:lipoamide acyltransferase component of branched-chain alpha-keto acid dehydrogenase complex [Dictyobacter sp. S3.2.2.5]
MPTPVKMPRLGESVAEGTIGSWLKQVGDTIERDEAIAEVITDKINAELPSPVAGRLVKILVQVDETVPVGTDIAMIEESADVPADSGTSGPDAAPVESVREADTPLPESSQPVGLPSNGTRVKQQREDEERQRISPLARRLAQEHGINLNDIAGTGAGGRVRKEDILAFVEQRQKVATPAAAAYAPSAPAAFAAPVAPQPARVEVAQPTSEQLTEAGDEVVSPSRMRLAIAEHMVRSKRTSPHATTVVEIDMTNIAKWLAKNKEEFKRREGYGISFVPFVMKAVCEGIRKYPIINSTWTPDNKIIIKRHINLGMAVSTDTGLVVPTIYDADQYTLAALAKQVNALAQRARANKLTVQDMQNSTFVVNNPGVFGTIISMPIINQPHAAILSMDAVVKRPVVIEDDAIAVRSMMFMSMSFDHRILDGAGAGGFLQAVRTKLQSYGRDIDVY